MPAASPQKHAAKPTPPLTKPKSIWTRKLDLLYLLYFLVHIPVMFLIDLTPLYPTALKPTFLTTLRTWYITTYADRFFTHPPAWFQLYMYMEALYHVPLSLWAVGALLRGKFCVFRFLSSPSATLVFTVRQRKCSLFFAFDPFLSSVASIYEEKGPRKSGIKALSSWSIDCLESHFSLPSLPCSCCVFLLAILLRAKKPTHAPPSIVCSLPRSSDIADPYPPSLSKNRRESPTTPALPPFY